MYDNLENINNDIMKNYKKSDDIVLDMQEIINASQKQALQAVNIALIRRNFLVFPHRNLLRKRSLRAALYPICKSF